jgi:hypothetical protein
MTTKHDSTRRKAEPKVPFYHAYTVREGKAEGQKPFWIRIGAVFVHDDGEGATLFLEELPFDRRIVLRAPAQAGDGE